MPCGAMRYPGQTGVCLYVSNLGPSGNPLPGGLLSCIVLYCLASRRHGSLGYAAMLAT